MVQKYRDHQNLRVVLEYIRFYRIQFALTNIKLWIYITKK